MIVGYHKYAIGFTGDYLFSGGWVWVEYFFILTGFYTARHFAQHPVPEDKNLSVEIMRYTLKKFSTYLPYIFAALPFACLNLYFQFSAQMGSIQAIKEIIKKLPFDMTFLASSYLGTSVLGLTWYLSSVMIILPVVCYLMIRFQNVWAIASWLIPLIYCGRYGIVGIRAWPHDMLKPLAWLSLGTFVYIVVYFFREYSFKKKLSKLFFTCVEIGSWLLAAYILAFNKNTFNLLFFLYTINAAIMLSGKSYTAAWNSPFLNLLGKVSLPIYLFHYHIGELMMRLEMENSVRTTLYYVIPISLAFLFCLSYEWFLKKRSLRCSAV